MSEKHDADSFSPTQLDAKRSPSSNGRYRDSPFDCHRSGPLGRVL